jgi:hypothetical protein
LLAIFQQRDRSPLHASVAPVAEDIDVAPAPLLWLLLLLLPLLLPLLLLLLLRRRLCLSG